jgi:hypothetical protein
MTQLEKHSAAVCGLSSLNLHVRHLRVCGRSVSRSLALTGHNGDVYATLNRVSRRAGMAQTSSFPYLLQFRYAQRRVSSAATCQRAAQNACPRLK